MIKRSKFGFNPYCKIIEKIREFEIKDDLKLKWNVAKSEVTASWVLRQSGWPYLALNSLKIDVSEFLNIYLKNSNEVCATQADGEGWKTLALLGNWKYPVFETEEYLKRITNIAPPRWQPYVTVDALKIIESLPFEKIMACEILALEPYGLVMPHRDHHEQGLSRFIIPITHYEKCLFRIAGKENLPFAVGVPMLFDPSHIHYTFNREIKTRYHLHIRGLVGNRAEEFNRHVICAAKLQNEKLLEATES